VQCLDVVRALQKQPAIADALRTELSSARGGHPALDRACASLEQALGDTTDVASRARAVVEQLALALSASLLVRHAPAYVADAYCASRLGDERGASYGVLPHDADVTAIVDRAWPA